MRARATLSDILIINTRQNESKAVCPVNFAYGYVAETRFLGSNN